MAAPAAQAQRKAERAGAAPPQPVAVTMKARRDEPASVPLRIFGTRNQTLTFLVRKPPASGKLGIPENVSAESAIVRYTPPADRAVKRETFTYAVRSADGVSAPVEVTIEIVDQPAELVAPAELRFGSVLVGAEVAQTFELVNRGGDLAEGVAEVDAPWRLDGSARYRLEPGGRTFLRVIFAPASPGQFKAELRYSSDPLRRTALEGEGRAPLALKPATLHLRLEPLTGARAGSFEVMNQTDLEQLVHLHASERLKLERKLLLAAGQRAVVAVQLDPADPGIFSERVRLKTERHETELPVSADPIPAALRVFPESLTLRGPDADGKWRAELLLENVGGAPLEAELRAAAPFAVSASRLTLPAGGKEMLAVTAAESSRSDAALVVHSPEGRRSIPLRTAAPVRARTEAGRPRKNTPREEIMQTTNEPSRFAREPSTNLPTITATRIIDRTDTSATLEWTGPSSPAGFRGEVRELAVVDDRLVVRWHPHVAFKADVSNGKMRGIFSGLKPGEFYAVRVVPNQANGAVEPVASALLETASPRKSGRWAIAQRLLLVLGAALAGAIFWGRYRSRRARL